MINITQEQIMQNWDNKNCDELLVSICCITYNHESYIEEALNGFIQQKTNFKYEIVISNDCSTDKTQQVIDKFKEKYPDLIRDISPRENLGSINNFYYALNSCNGKYIAYCEGDDYWIDENKLQMQVDFLEKNPEYGMCYTRAKQFIQSKKRFKNKIGKKTKGIKDLLINDYVIPTLTTCFRSDIYFCYCSEIEPWNKNWLMGDYPLWLYFSEKTNVFFFIKTTSVYRVLTNSASHSPDNEKNLAFFRSVYEVKKYFCDRYGYDIIPDYFSEYYQTKMSIIKKYNRADAKKLRFYIRKLHRYNVVNIVYFLASYSNFIWTILIRILRKR